jgi:hypothetical protein
MPRPPTIYTPDVSATVTASVAQEVIARAGIGHGDEGCWRLPDGSQTTDPRITLTAALVALADEDQ